MSGGAKKKRIGGVMRQIDDNIKKGVSVAQLAKVYGYKPELIQSIGSFMKDADNAEDIDAFVKQRGGDPTFSRLLKFEEVDDPLVTKKKPLTADELGAIINTYDEMDPRKKFGSRVESIAKKMGDDKELYKMSERVPEELKNLTCIGGVGLVHQRAGNKFSKDVVGCVKNSNYEKEGISGNIEYNPSFWNNADKLGYDVFDLDDLSTVRKGDIVGKYGMAYDGQRRMMHSNIMLQDGAGIGSTPLEKGKNMLAYDSYQATNAGAAIVNYPYVAGEKNGEPVKFKVARIKASKAAEIEGAEFQEQWNPVSEAYINDALPILKKNEMLRPYFSDYNKAKKAGNASAIEKSKARIVKVLQAEPELLKQLFDGN